VRLRSAASINEQTKETASAHAMLKRKRVTTPNIRALA